MDHDKTRECYEFLDLSDVDDSERNHLTTALYSSDHNQHASWVHDNDNTAVDQNVPAVQNSWHETPFGLTSEQIADVTPATPSVVRNLVMPRLLTPLGALPIYAIVKPSLAPIAAVPTICTPTTHVLSGAVTSVSSNDIDYIKDNQSQSAMSPQPTPQITQQGVIQQQTNMNNQHQQQHQQQQHQQQNNQAVYAPQQQYIGQVGTQIGGAMYQILPHVMPNVYVSNVSPNVNVHGYMTQAIPQYMTNTTPTFVHLTEANQGGQLHEHQQASNPNTNVTTNIRGNSRRGRGRGNGHRREYVPRAPPQQQQQQQQQEIVQSMMESQQVLGAPSGFTQYYINPYWVGHPSTQHPSGSALYLSAGQIPVYAAAAGHQMYAYHTGMMYQSMIPNEYGVVLDEKNDEHGGGGGPENIPNGTVMQQMWHPHMGIEYQEQQMEIPPPNQEEMLQLEIIEDVNQNIMQIPMQMTQHQPHPNQIPQQIPMHSPHVLNPNVATFTSLKTQQQQYQGGDYMVSSNMMVQQSISVNQHSNNQQMNKVHQVQNQPHPPPQPTPPIVVAIPPVLHQQNISEQINVNNSNKTTENKNLNLNYNKDLTQVPSTLVTNMNIKVPVATTVTNNNNNKNSNFINNVNRISNNNNNSVSTKINQNVPNPSSNSTDVVVSASGNSSTSFVNSNMNDDTVNKLVKVTNDKLMIKNERSNKPPAWNNNNNNNNSNNNNIYNNSYNNSNKNVNISNITSVAKKVSNPSAPTVTAISNSLVMDNKIQPLHTPLIVNYSKPVQKTVSNTSVVVNQTLPAVTSATPAVIARQKLSPPPFANNPAVVKSNNSPFVPKSNQINSSSSIISNTPSGIAGSHSGIITDQLRNVSQMVSNKKTEVQKLVTTPQNSSAITNVVSASALQPQLIQTQLQTIVEPTVLHTIDSQPIASINKSVIPMQINKEAISIVNNTAIPMTTPINNNVIVEYKEKQIPSMQSSVVVHQAAALTPSELSTVTLSVIKEKEPVTPQTVLASVAPAPSTKSWASLFVGGKSTGSVVQSSSVDQIGKKPVAKVFPFEGTANYNPIQTPGGISYSAASSQGLSVVNNGDAKKTTLDQHPHQNLHSSEIHNLKVLDGWSSRLGVFFLKYQIDNNSACITPRGLTNRSNYCYINAILQALISCPPFYNLLRSIPTQPSGLRSKSTTPIIDAMTDLAAEFSMMSAPPAIRITRREKGQKREDLLPDVNPDAPFEPTVIHKMLNGIRSDVFQVEGRQEDAEEFLGCVLNKMNDEMLEVMKMVDNKNKVVNGTIEKNIEEQNDEGSDWQVIYGSRNKGSITRTTDFGRTPISDIFRGQSRSRVQREGDASNDVVQPFFTLQLYIEKAASVKEALEILVVKDQLEGVTCSKTKQEVAAWQQVTIEELPIILILHLKCFDYKMDGCTKILKTVEFPIELKIDSKFLSSKNKYTQKQKQYKLFAVVYHDGKEAVKGHYLTDVFHAGYNSWIRYDDSIVKPVTEHHVLHPRSPRIPYLLYYRRCDTIGGGGNGGGGSSNSSSSSGAAGQQQQQSTSSK